MSTTQQEATDIQISKDNIGYFLKGLEADKQPESASRRGFHELIGKEVEKRQQHIMSALDTALRVDGENVFEISRELLEEVLSFIDSHAPDGDTEYDDKLVATNPVDALYDRLRDETGHEWE